MQEPPSLLSAQVSEKLETAFQAGKEEDDSNFDKTASLIKAIPGLLKKFTIWLLKLADYFGLLPFFLLDVSPFPSFSVKPSVISLISCSPAILPIAASCTREAST